MLQSCRGPSDAGPTWMVGADHSLSSPHTKKRHKTGKKFMWTRSSKSLGETQHCFWKSEVGKSFFPPHILAPKAFSPLKLGFQGENRNNN